MKTEEYDHSEAFCIMKYRCRRCHHIMQIWNSRDGVTPFSIDCTKESCNGIMEHVDWKYDEHHRYFVPSVGSYIFESENDPEGKRTHEPALKKVTYSMHTKFKALAEKHKGV